MSASATQGSHKDQWTKHHTTNKAN